MLPDIHYTPGRFGGLMVVLKSVPGIDEIWACIIAAKIGDFSRFPNADALEFWADLSWQ